MSIFDDDRLLVLLFKPGQRRVLNNKHEFYREVLQGVYEYFLEGNRYFLLKKKIKTDDLVTRSILEVLNMNKSIRMLLEFTSANAYFSLIASRNIIVELLSIIPVTITASSELLDEINEDIRTMIASKNEGNEINERDLEFKTADAKLITQALESNQRYAIKIKSEASMADVQNNLSCRIRSTMQSFSNHERILEATLTNYLNIVDPDNFYYDLINKYKYVHDRLNLNKSSFANMNYIPKAMRHSFDRVIIACPGDPDTFKEARLLSIMSAFNIAKSQVILYIEDSNYALNFSSTVSPNGFFNVPEYITDLYTMSEYDLRDNNRGDDGNNYGWEQFHVKEIIKEAKEKNDTLVIMLDDQEKYYANAYEQCSRLYGWLGDYKHVVDFNSEPDHHNFYDNSDYIIQYWNIFVEQLEKKYGTSSNESGRQ